MARTNHKYDTVDYNKVDPGFGDEAVLRCLLDGAHSHGMHVVLDAVFNHCGTTFKPWVDVCKKQERSRYKDWFHIQSFPVDPKADEAHATFEYFGNHPYLPKLNTQNPEVSAFLLGVAERWTKFGIDGWRLDAANEVDHALWRDLRTCVRAINPETLLVAEIWHEATQFVHAGELDGLTHFPFLGACREFIAVQTMDAAEFVNRVTRARVPYQEQAVLWNVLGTHDTPRFLTECRGDTRKMRLGFTMQMTYAGVPHIYYGDEIGLAGALDPGCRGCMEWDPDRQNLDLLAHVRALVDVRRRHQSLRSGDCITLSAEPRSRLFAFIRHCGCDVVIVAINAGRKAETLDLPGSTIDPHRVWRDALGAGKYELRDDHLIIDLEPWQGAVLLPVR
jgi:glycosidase